MCKVITVTPHGYQPGYPVIKRSRFKNYNERLRQPIINSKQYHNGSNLFSKFVWHKIYQKITEKTDSNPSTSANTPKISQNSEYIQKNPSNDNNNSNKQNQIIVNWTHNYYYPLIATPTELPYSEQDENLVKGVPNKCQKQAISYSSPSTIKDKQKQNIIDNTDNEHEFLDAIIQFNNQHYNNIEKLETIKSDHNIIIALPKRIQIENNNNEKDYNNNTMDDELMEQPKPITTRAKAAQAAQAKASLMKLRVDEMVGKSKQMSTVVKKVAIKATAIACQNHLTSNKVVIDDTIQEVSNKYIPEKLPKFTSNFKSDYMEEEEEENDEKDHDLSMVIKIDCKKHKNLVINNRRLFISVSKALKYFAPDIKVTIKNTNDYFNDFDNTTYNEEELTTIYMESPTMSKNHIFTVRINYKSSISFHRIMHKNTELKNWLRQAGIMLELNNISELDLVNVGFFIKCHPRASIINSQVKRLTDLMEVENEADIPEFMASSSPIWHNSEVTHVLMIRASLKEKDAVTRAFTKIMKYTSMQFISWNYWKEIDSDIKNTIVLTQQAYHEQYASIILSKFIDNDNIKMNHGMDLKSIPDNWKTCGEMNISDYLKYYYKTAKNEHFIDIVYPPSNGIREILVPRIYANQAFRWARNVKAELFNILSPAARPLVFQDIKKVTQEANDLVEVWSGNSLELEFAPTILEPNNKRSIKRVKTNQSIITKSNTYAEVTSKLLTKQQPIIMPPNNNNILSAPVNQQQNVQDSVVRTELDILKSNQQELFLQVANLKAGLHTNTHEIQKTHEEIKKTKVEIQKTNVEISKTNVHIDNIKTDVTNSLKEIYEHNNNNIMQLTNKMSICDNKFDKMYTLMENMSDRLSYSGDKENLVKKKVQRLDDHNLHDEMQIGGNHNSYEQGTYLGSLPKL